MSPPEMEKALTIVAFVELRYSIILTMALQILVMVWPNLHKLSVSHPSVRITWLVFYLAIDFFTTLALGIIFHINMDPNHDRNPQNKYLLSLWAPVVLRYLGGHCTVTAFSLADNEFWLSHIIRFIYYELMSLAICVLSFTEKQLRVSSFVLLIVSTFKFGERVWALKRGGIDELRRSTIKEADPGVKIIDVIRIARRTEEANRAGELGFDIHQIDIPEEQAPGLTVHSKDPILRYLCAAYKSFSTHKHIYTGDSLTNRQGREERGQPFSGMNNVNACKLVEIELNFAYDLFYTKRVFLHSLCGWISRITLIFLICLALGFFACIDTRDFFESDVSFTYSLLITTLFLEVVSFFESIASNRTLVQVGFGEGSYWRWLEKIIQWLLSIGRWTGRRIFPRQSISIGQFSLLSFCDKDYKSRMWPKKVLNFFELKEHWDNYWYTSCISLDDHDELKNNIFNQVRSRIEEEQEEERNSDETHKWFSGILSRSVSIWLSPNSILKERIGSDFERCVIIWHVATDLCYRNSEPSVHLQNAKYISENMLYLLKVHPSMLSSLVTTELKSYNYVCSATTQLFSDSEITNDGVDRCLHNIFSEVQEENIVGRNSLLLDGFILARELIKLENVWELTLTVWIDIMSYAAFHSKGKHHAERLGSGGEFLTRVWLFMHHLMNGSCYQIEAENAAGE